MKDPKQELAKVLKRHVKLKESEISSLLETPPDSKLGDLAFPCFILSKKLKKAPNAIASSLSKKIKPFGVFSKIKAIGPYLNFFLNDTKISEAILKKIFKEKSKYGKSASKKKTAVVEYFQANTHKPVHIGHFRNICLGESLARIFEFKGFKVYRVSYGGDIGTHVAKCLWAYQKYHSKHRIEKEKNKGAWLGKVYAEGAMKFNESAKARNEIKELTNKLYLGKDKKLMNLWKKTRTWSIEDFKPILREINVKFNAMLWESQVSKPALTIAKDLLKKKVAEKSEGAVGINLEKYGLGYFILLTSEGYPLYSAKDLALAKLKYQKFKGIENSIHVVGSEQNLHFKQLFKTFELAGFKKLLRKNHHLSYQLVMLKSGKMSSRTGDVITYSDLVEKAN
jgi:arginyl-tRNA synthetase